MSDGGSEEIFQFRLVKEHQTGLVAVYNTKDASYYIPKKNFEAKTKTRRRYARQPHMNNQATTSMIRFLKNHSIVPRNASFNTIVLKLQDMITMYPEDEWLQSLEDEHFQDYDMPRKFIKSPPKKNYIEEEEEGERGGSDLKKIRLIIREEIRNHDKEQVRKEVKQEILQQLMRGESVQ